MGKPIKTPKEQFIKNLEKNGFVDNGGSYKGKYFNEEVLVLMGEEKDGYYNLVAVSTGMLDSSKSAEYYRKVTSSLEEEYSKYMKYENCSNGVTTQELIKKDGGSIKTTMAIKYGYGMVVTVYKAE